MKYLIDTNICIEIIRRNPANIMRRLLQSEPGDAGVSTITVAELEYGARKSSAVEQNLEALERFLLPLAIVDFDPSAATEYGRVRSELEKAGTPIGSMDTLIGAHALALGAILVTNNTREFSRLSRLALEDWTHGK